MTKKICDICGKDMPSSLAFTERLSEMKFAISSNGRCWDICDECRYELNMWFQRRKEQNNEC